MYGSLTMCTHARKHSATGLVYKSVKRGGEEAARPKLRAQLLDMSILYLNGEEEAQSSSQQGSGTKDFFWMAQNSQSKPYPFA